MTGETLNIKIRLDTSEATAGAKRLKTQLTSMAGQVKKGKQKQAHTNGRA